MSRKSRPGRGAANFKVSMEELEASAHVPLDDQIESVQEPPPPIPVGDEWRRQQEMLRYASGG